MDLDFLFLCDEILARPLVDSYCLWQWLFFFFFFFFTLCVKRNDVRDFPRNFAVIMGIQGSE